MTHMRSVLGRTTIAAAALVVTCAAVYRSFAGDVITDNLTVNNGTTFYGPVSAVRMTNSPPSTNGLICHFSLSTNSTPVSDDSGNGHTGTVYGGVAWTNAGIVGGAYYFDGQDDYIDVGDADCFSPSVTSMTWAVWVKPLSAGTTRYLLTKGTSAAYEWGLQIYQSPNAFDWNVWNSAGTAGDNLRSTTTVVTGRWYFVVIAYDKSTSTTRMYVNGVKEAEGPRTVTLSNTSSKFMVGRFQYHTAAMHCGLMDEVRIYNRALTATEIMDIYACGVPATPNANAGAIDANRLTLSGALQQTNTVGTNVLMGKVGIGTNQPNTLLDVGGDATVRGALTVVGGMTGSGAGLSGLNATNLTVGTVPLERLSGVTTNEMAATEREKIAAAQNASQVTDIVGAILSTNVAADSAKFGGKEISSFMLDDGMDAWQNDENGGGRTSYGWQDIETEYLCVRDSQTTYFWLNGVYGGGSRIWSPTSMSLCLSSPNGNNAFTIGSYFTWFSINGYGNVGLGTEDPQAKLHVNGSARFEYGIEYHPPLGNLSMGVYTNR